MSRAGQRNFLQAVGAHSARVGAQPWPIYHGTIKSYDSQKHTAIARVELGNGDSYETTPAQIMCPWWGQGYGEAGGPDEGVQCLLALVDPSGNIFVILGFTPNDVEDGFNVPVGEKWVTDKRGSFVKWLTAGVLALAGNVKTYLGGETLDDSLDAVSTKRYVDEAIARQTAQTQADIAAWAAAHVQPGSGAAGPTGMTAVTSRGSTTVKAAP